MKIMNVVRKFAAPALVAASVVTSAASFAAGSLDSATVTAVQGSVIADAGTASGAGFAVMTVVLSLSIGFGLLSKFISKGAKG
jgi:hypothetical protein